MSVLILNKNFNRNYRLPFERAYQRAKLKITLSGRSKRNIPLPVFQKEPMGRINEFTYKE